MFIFAGIIGFGFYYFYDLNTVFFKSRVGRSCFILGTLLLTCSTIGLIIGALFADPSVTICLPMGIPALVLLGLEIYTLFFALPAGEAYKGSVNDGKMEVCSFGMYALCRHPGVLWLAGFYLTLYLTFPTRQMGMAAIIFSLLDLLYVILQDYVIFPRQFRSYGEYRKKVPFLIPTPGSIRQMITDLTR